MRGGDGGSDGGRRFSEGVNFAVAGATALDLEYYENFGMYNSLTNVSLGTQLDWLRQFLSIIPGKVLLVTLLMMPSIISLLILVTNLSSRNMHRERTADDTYYEINA